MDSKAIRRLAVAAFVGLVLLAGLIATLSSSNKSQITELEAQSLSDSVFRLENASGTEVFSVDDDGDATTAGTSQAEHIYSTDDAVVSDVLTAGSAVVTNSVQAGGITSTGGLAVSAGDVDFPDGAVSLDDLTWNVPVVISAAVTYQTSDGAVGPALPQGTFVHRTVVVVRSTWDTSATMKLGTTDVWELNPDGDDEAFFASGEVNLEKAGSYRSHTGYETEDDSRMLLDIDHSGASKGSLIIMQWVTFGD